MAALCYHLALGDALAQEGEVRFRERKKTLLLFSHIFRVYVKHEKTLIWFPPTKCEK